MRILLPTLVALLIFATSSEARRRQRLPTHPIFLWAKTLTDSRDQEQRKVAAFKISQYSQPIYQTSVIDALLQCVNDPNSHIKVLCTKSLGRVRKRGRLAEVKKVLIKKFQTDAFLQNTVIRTLTALQATDARIYDLLLSTAKTATKPELVVALMTYFEAFGKGDDPYVKELIALYKKHKNPRVKTAIIKALTESAAGQTLVVSLLADCTKHDDTPLVLTCLSGLEIQGTRSPHAWRAVHNTVFSQDPDVLEATLDIIDTLAERPDLKIATRLLNLINEVEDADIREKAVLGLGVCGDKSEDIVEVLNKLVEEKGVDEDIRIAAALVLGKQATLFPDTPKRVLANCQGRERSQSLRTACQLGLQELETRSAKASPPKKRRPASQKKAKN